MLDTNAASTLIRGHAGAALQSLFVERDACISVITEAELGDNCCPECREVHKVSRSDFETILPDENKTVRYCCERCGAIIDC